MQIKDFLNAVCEQIKYKPIRQDIAKELEDHMEEIKENYIKEGLNKETAENKAIEQMGEAEDIGKKLNKIHKPKFDWKLVLIGIMLLCFGFLISYIRTTSLVTTGNGINYMIKYLIALIIGCIISIGIYLLNYKKIFKYSNYIYAFATISIIWTLCNGMMINGVPYLKIGTSGISIDSIAVPLYIVAFVGFLMSEKKESKIQNLLNKLNIKADVNLIKIILLSIISIILLLEIPSRTSAFILGITYLIVATIKIFKLEKDRKKKIITLWTVPIILGIIIMTIYVGDISRLDRITAVFNPESDPDGSGWLALNRKLIINSAQYFEEADDMSQAIEIFDEGTNFAFISILAHYGWIVSTALVITILLLCVKLIMNVVKIKDVSGKLLIIGISTMFILQSIFNILMNLNLGIEADFNLPFVSYSVANLIINMMSLALILSVYRRKNIIITTKDKTNECLN